MKRPHAHTRVHPAHEHKPREYCHVIIDGTGANFYAAPAKYEEDVLSYLKPICHSPTGQAVFREFQNGWPHQLKIVPRNNNWPNAEADPKDWSHALKPGQFNDARGQAIVGEGGGSDSVVPFSPDIWRWAYNVEKPGHRSGARPDEVLFHEMVHAARQIRGISSLVPVGVISWHVARPVRPSDTHMLQSLGLQGKVNRIAEDYSEHYPNEDEFFAILLTNIYISERTGRRIDLRQDHDGSDHRLDDTDAKFLPNRSNRHYQLVSKLVHEDHGMARQLASIPRIVAPFNPIRRYFELERAAPHEAKPDF